MARIDAIIQQQNAGHINLECGLVATTFQGHCDVVRKKRHTEDALEEAATVAGYAAFKRRCTNPGACDCEDNEEVNHTEKYIIQSDEDIEAAQAYLDAEDALFAYDVAVGEAVAEALALEDHLLFPVFEYPYLVSYVYGCGCEQRFGLDDDGEVIHNNCP